MFFFAEQGTLRSDFPMAESLNSLHLVLRDVMNRSFNNRLYEEHNVSMIEPGLYLGDG